MRHQTIRLLVLILNLKLSFRFEQFQLNIAEIHIEIRSSLFIKCKQIDIYSFSWKKVVKKPQKSNQKTINIQMQIWLLSVLFDLRQIFD